MTSKYDQVLRPATINIPGCFGGPNRRIDCNLLETNAGRLTIEAEECLPLSTAVSIEHNDALFLAEVIRCSSSSADVWRLEMKVEQILTGLQSLLALRSQLIGEQQVQMEPVCVPVRAYVH